jgi:hypothetical protein
MVDHSQRHCRVKEIIAAVNVVGSIGKGTPFQAVRERARVVSSSGKPFDPAGRDALEVEVPIETKYRRLVETELAPLDQNLAVLLGTPKAAGHVASPSSPNSIRRRRVSALSRGIAPSPPLRSEATVRSTGP